MIFKSLLAFSILFFFVSPSYAAHSIITEAEGSYCADKKSKKKVNVKNEALADAKRKALEKAVSYIEGEIITDNADLKKDILEAYSQTDVKILESKEAGRSGKKKEGKCYKVWIKAEVMPDEKAMEQIGLDQQFTDEPSAPLRVQVWTDKQEYKRGEKITVYFKGNKPFYAVVLYQDVKGGLVQLLPNPFREDNYFNSGEAFEIPSIEDKYELRVTPPLGDENIIIYASTSQLGELEITPRGAFYLIKTRPKDIGEKTRRVNLKENPQGPSKSTAEFFEGKADVKTSTGEPEGTPDL